MFCMTSSFYIFSSSRKLKQTNHLFVLDRQHTENKPILLRLRCISNHSKIFLDTICDAKLVEITSDLVRQSQPHENLHKLFS